MSILLNRPLLMICQIKPKIRCSFPSCKSADPILTTEHPIPFAEVMTILLFSVIWKAFRGRAFPPALGTEGLFRTRSSMVSGTESLINLQSTRPSNQLAIFLGQVIILSNHLGIHQTIAWCRKVWEGGDRCPCRQQEPVMLVYPIVLRRKSRLTPLM